MNNPVFQQFNNTQSRNAASYKAQLESKLREMQKSGVNPDQIIGQGISDGKISQNQVNFAYNIARNIAKNLFGVN